MSALHDELADAMEAAPLENEMSKKTIGRFTFVIWKDRGMKLDGGRVMYHTARKYWLRLGAWIVSVEIADKDRVAV